MEGGFFGALAEGPYYLTGYTRQFWSINGDGESEPRDGAAHGIGVFVDVDTQRSVSPQAVAYIHQEPVEVVDVRLVVFLSLAGLETQFERFLVPIPSVHTCASC